MSGDQFTDTEIPQQFLDNFEFTISITFPGEVISSTGEVDGNTVTWQPQVGENNPIEARASAIPSPSSPWLIVLVVALGALLLGAVAFLLMHRRAPVAAEGPIDEGALPPPPTEQVAAPDDATSTGPPRATEPMPLEGPTAPVEPPPPPGSAVPRRMNHPPPAEASRRDPPNGRNPPGHLRLRPLRYDVLPRARRSDAAQAYRSRAGRHGMPCHRVKMP